MRPSTIEYFLDMARLVGSRSTCYRRNVGCVLVDRYNRVLATGYNGVASGTLHCNEEIRDQSYVAVIGSNRVPSLLNTRFPNLCEGAESPSGTNLNNCKAIHAEINALISCRNPEDIRTCYVTASPCIFCVRPLMNTPCEDIVFEEEYPHPEAKQLWTVPLARGRAWVHYLRAAR